MVTMVSTLDGVTASGTAEGAAVSEFCAEDDLDEPGSSFASVQHNVETVSLRVPVVDSMGDCTFAMMVAEISFDSPWDGDAAVRGTHYSASLGLLNEGGGGECGWWSSMEDGEDLDAPGEAVGAWVREVRWHCDCGDGDGGDDAEPATQVSLSWSFAERCVR